MRRGRFPVRQCRFKYPQRHRLFRYALQHARTGQWFCLCDISLFVDQDVKLHDRVRVEPFRPRRKEGRDCETIFAGTVTVVLS